MAEEWPFADKKNVAVFTIAEIANGSLPILYVSHDPGDGAWQFHSGNDLESETPKILSLEEIVEIDPSLKELSDLPKGWIATRKSKEDKWHREKDTE